MVKLYREGATAFDLPGATSTMNSTMTNEQALQELGKTRLLLVRHMQIVKRKRLRPSEKAMTLAAYAMQEMAILHAIRIVADLANADSMAKQERHETLTRQALGV